MDPQKTLLATLVTLMLLSGCIAYQEDPDTSAMDEAPPEDPEPIPSPGFKEVFTHRWTGFGMLDERFTVTEDHDYLFTHFQHTGQAIGHPVFTVDGTPMDESTLSSTSGVYTLMRTLPGANGTTELGLTGILSGVGHVTATGVTDIVPPTLLSVSWTGQRIDGAHLADTQIRFHVPEGLETLEVTLGGTGQTLPGMYLVDPNGKTVGALTPGAGPQSREAEAEAVPGIWTLHVEGATSGPWSAHVKPLDPLPGNLDGDLDEQ